MAVSAVVATLTVARQQRAGEQGPPPDAGPQRPPAANPLDLDALRSAGL